MLQSLRDNSKGVISGILIGFLVVIFALSGTDALINFVNTENQGVVNVNGEKITETEIARASVNYKQQLTERYGDSIPADFLTDEKVRQPVIEELIRRKVLIQSAENSGMVVADNYLNQQILETPQFHNEDGVFDSSRYQQLLRSFGYTPTTYKKVLAEDVLVNQLSAGVLQSSFVTPTEIEEIIALSFQTRDFTYAVIPAAKVGESVKVEDAEVQSYYEANSQTFTYPEEVAVDYIDLSVSSLMEGVEVSDEQARAQFEQTLSAFVAKPERHAAHILIENNDAEKIADVDSKLKAGEDFTALAKAYSDDLGTKDQGGDLGFTTGETFPQEFETALAGLKVGAVSEPVKTDAGTHFIKLLAEKGSEPPKFEEQKAVIVDQLKRAEAESNFMMLLDRLRDLSYNAESLAEVAEELGVKHENTGLFSRNSGVGVASNSQFVTAAFSGEVLNENISSEVIELTPDHVVVLKKTDHKPSYVKPLNDVKEEIVKVVHENKVRELLASQGQALEAAVMSGQSLADAAKASGLEVKTAAGVARNDVSIDRDVLRQAFDLPKPNESAPEVIGTTTSSGDFAVIALTGVTLGGKEVPAEQRLAVTSQLRNITSQEEYGSYQNLLRDQAEIEN